ncbi:mannose-1-phosphate guanylyltransferase/mannose-6-phosphate isomerase [Castellaniella sp.]|uniref:mannose-1-phosphate guanylyltransferase/mannose-6-phosphate isomerase n=1 Tax=Castellaniella sp. TaxID=1955812 RepID=UPI00355DC2E9
MTQEGHSTEFAPVGQPPRVPAPADRRAEALLPVVLAGGSGTRLWPLSREYKPKQFLALAGEQTLLQQALQRLQGLDCLAPILVCNEKHRFLAAEQMHDVGLAEGRVLLEPCPRNTAPAIALAALMAMGQGADPLLLVLAADHRIGDVARWQQAVQAARTLAQQGRLATFGIVPDRPETGYGYIRRGTPLASGWQVRQFVEKPDAQTAQAYLDSGEYYWNSGMFLFRASDYLQALQASRPDILAACRQAWAGCVHDLDFVRIGHDDFAACPAESVDCAVMEHTTQAAMVALDAGWDDLGAWSALAQVQPDDAQGNRLRGDVLMHAAHDNLVRADHRLVALVGVQDLVVVETRDAVLVARKDQVQDVKAIVAQLQAAGRSEHLRHREEWRPWGHFDAIGSGPRYQVKKITVKPGGKLSLQKHHHRAEHWVVVSGTAQVTKGDQTYLVSENQSTYIPIGQVHSLENPGVIPLELIEVQSGAYLGEDDIVRLEDRYGRV